MLAVAASNIPTTALRQKPPRPLYFYIVPLLRVKVGCVGGQCNLFTASLLASWRFLACLPIPACAVSNWSSPLGEQDLLAGSGEYITDADWPTVKQLVMRVKVGGVHWGCLLQAW